jgi:hypothetical protein
MKGTGELEELEELMARDLVLRLETLSPGLFK